MLSSIKSNNPTKTIEKQTFKSLVLEVCLYNKYKINKNKVKKISTKIIQKTYKKFIKFKK